MVHDERSSLRLAKPPSDSAEATVIFSESILRDVATRRAVPRGAMDEACGRGRVGERATQRPGAIC
eukprot:6480322-Prymnesium_polylepis.2